MSAFPVNSSPQGRNNRQTMNNSLPMFSKGAKVVLSPLTTIENQFLNLTNDIVVYGEENCILGAGPSKEDQINEGNAMLAKKMSAT